VPIFILKKNVVLITLRPMDFSFVLEESLSKIFVLVEKHRLKVSLIQSSAVSISICVDNSRYLHDAIDELSNEFSVSYNENLELLTIRGRTNKAIEQTTQKRDILLKQLTRRNARFLMKEK
ncbi:MAG: aspartate kinase, partial [Paludibacter sp.]